MDEEHDGQCFHEVSATHFFIWMIQDFEEMGVLDFLATGVDRDRLDFGNGVRNTANTRVGIIIRAVFQSEARQAQHG